MLYYITPYYTILDYVDIYYSISPVAFAASGKCNAGQTPHVSITCIYIYIDIFIYIYIYIYREREREIDIYINTYIYIYMYVCMYV